MAGDGPDLAALRIKLAPFGNRISFTGWVAPSDVSWLVSQHDVMVMPSRYEGFGSTLIEAMSQGCPVVASRIPGVTDTIVTDGEDGFLFPIGNCRQAAQQIERLAADPRLRVAMGAAGVRKVIAEFDSEIVGRAYAGLLQHLRENRPPITPPLALSQWSMPNALHKTCAAACRSRSRTGCAACGSACTRYGRRPERPLSKKRLKDFVMNLFTSQFRNSQLLASKAHALIPGGCHTYAKGDDQYPVLAPGFIQRGSGAHVFDVDGHEYIEYGMGNRAVGLGHAYPPVVRAVREALQDGCNFTRPSAIELDCAESFLELIEGRKWSNSARTARMRLPARFALPAPIQGVTWWPAAPTIPSFRPTTGSLAPRR